MWVNTTSALSAGRQGPRRPFFKKIAHLVGQLGSAPHLVADSADVVLADRADIVFTPHLKLLKTTETIDVERVGLGVWVSASFQKIACLVGCLGWTRPCGSDGVRSIQLNVSFRSFSISLQ